MRVVVSRLGEPARNCGSSSISRVLVPSKCFSCEKLLSHGGRFMACFSNAHGPPPLLFVVSFVVVLFSKMNLQTSWVLPSGNSDPSGGFFQLLSLLGSSSLSSSSFPWFLCSIFDTILDIWRNSVTFCTASTVRRHPTTGSSGFWKPRTFPP